MKYVAFLSAFLLCQLAFAQTASVKGRISNNSGEPVPFATVLLSETQQGSTARTDGSFELQKIPPGSYRLLVSSIGYQALSREVTLAPGEELWLDLSLAPHTGQLEEVMVTATRTARSTEDIPLPVEVISAEEIQRMGSMRLQEVLQEQTGLQLVSDHGTGLQMQGLGSEYILFLIDGEPLIGRTAGTLELNRLAVDNIERIEIIKGPSSSLYGSEAMAGVVNIITKKPGKGFSSSLRSLYRSFGTSDVNAEVSVAGEKLSVSLFANRLSSRGYDLNPETLSMTAPPFQAYTVNPSFAYRISDRLKLNVQGRWYTESQENTRETLLEGETFRMEDRGLRQDWNLMPTLDFRLRENHRLQLRNYLTGYRTESSLRYHADGRMYDESFFNQQFRRSELQYDWHISERHISTAGLGHTTETVEATRYQEVNSFRAAYAFVQHQWIPATGFNLIVGGRFDAHSAYASRFSPKIAAGYQLNEWVKLQASFGGGYKAPDFRQLLLNYTNPVVGYTVLGSGIVEQRMAELTAQGQINRLFRDPAEVETIKAESSIAWNAGLDFTPSARFRSELNLFRNQISNLIDTAPIAQKTNGQNVFSYFNFDEVITQGVELKTNYQLSPALDFSAGYQYLDSRNMEDVRRIRQGEVFRRDPASGRTRAVSLAEYGGLPNRSRHSGNARLFYTNHLHRFDVGLRAIYRGRWGLGDANGNGIVEAENEYADAYFLLNLSVNKALFGWLKLEAGANNLLGSTNPFEPSLPGRIWYGGLRIHFSEINQTN